MFGWAYRPAGRRRHLASFTLVELLVVIAVMTILLGILLPSLRAACDQAKCVVCASRLKQWGTAFECYAAENNGVWPHCDGLDRQDPPDPSNPDYHDPSISPADLADWHGWVDVLPPLIYHQAWRYYGIGEHPRTGTFYQCPTARLTQPVSLYGYYPREDGYFSYAMNSCLELDENAWPPPDGINNLPSFLDTSKIVLPAQVVLLFDQLLDVHKGYGGKTPYRKAGQHCGGYPIAFAARHARAGSTLGGNILFCDGHVQWQRTVWKPEWGDWDIGHQQGPPRDDQNWYPYPADPADRR